MNQKSLADKSRTLEESFFRDRDQGLLEYLRSQPVELRTQLAEISQIDDVEVLNGLIRIGITAESFTALTLLPLVRIAWADREVQDSERAAILQAARAENILVDSTSYRLLEGWLDERPKPALFESWSEYAGALARELDDVSLAAVRQSTLDRARRIAETAGGILGLGKRITKTEELALIDLARSFDKPSELL